MQLRPILDLLNRQPTSARWDDFVKSEGQKYSLMAALDSSQLTPPVDTNTAEIHTDDPVVMNCYPDMSERLDQIHCNWSQEVRMLVDMYRSEVAQGLRCHRMGCGEYWWHADDELVIAKWTKKFREW